MTNKKKNSLGFAIAVLAIFALSIVQLPQVSAETFLSAELSTYSPHPASPGDVVKVWVLVQNTGDSDARNVQVRFIEQYPFSLYNAADEVKTISILGANKDYLLEYTLKVDENAIPGENSFRLQYTDDSTVRTGIAKLSDIDLFIQSKDATLIIESVSTEPAQISPGEDGVIKIKVKNTAPARVTDLDMKLYFFASSASLTQDLPFAPIDSGAEKRIYQLAAGETAEFTYNIRVYPDAVSKVYKVPFTMTYYDSLGNQLNKSDYIGVIVNSVPDVAVMLDDTDLVDKKRQGTVTLKFVNKGLSDIKFLNVKLLDTPDYDLLTKSDTIYIGNLVSDDYQTSEYAIAVNTDKNSVQIPVIMQYRDSNNKYYEVTENVTVNLLDSSRLASAQNTGGSSLFIILLIIVVAAIGVWIYMRRRAKKNKKAQFG